MGAIKRVIDSGLLGEPLYASLTNLAQDEILPPAHWFWDRSKSGGIFIEHGVHFFDLFEWWFGPGRIISAHQIARPGTLMFDQVNCQVRYGDMTLGSFYHGFHQMLRRDRQDWQIAFELGVISLSEWVPTRLEADVTLADSDFIELMQILPDPRAQVIERATGSERIASSRNQPRKADIHAVFTCGAGVPKMELYGNVVRALMIDQLAAIHSPKHQRRVSEANGLSSLAYAVEAQAMADAAAGSPQGRLRNEGKEFHSPGPASHPANS
ncbi:MAG: Gfo/Idh/MocA family oxidoreductase [Verrucomicrobiota bacterium]